MLGKLASGCILFLLTLGWACAGPADDPDHPTDVTHLIPAAPEGSCGSHLYQVDGGAYAGGVDIYHSNCSTEYFALWLENGYTRSYHGYAGPVPTTAGDDFCESFPGAPSCGNENPWCTLDPDDQGCTGE